MAPLASNFSLFRVRQATRTLGLRDRELGPRENGGTILSHHFILNYQN
jgi:hypothetical protein